MLASESVRLRPVYWHFPPSRSKSPFRLKLRRLRGTRSKLERMTTVGMRMRPWVVPMEASPSRMGRFCQSDQETGVIQSEDWISRPVTWLLSMAPRTSAGLVAVRASQFRLRTRTVVLWSMVLGC